jgi:hypothetical protein
MAKAEDVNGWDKAGGGDLEVIQVADICRQKDDACDQNRIFR